MAFDRDQFVVDSHYPATIVAVSITESDNGNPGISLTAETANGRIDGVLWITAATRERVVKTIQDIGVDPACLGTDEFWDDPGSALLNVECSIVPDINTYDPDNPQWRVKWWNGRRKQASAAVKSKAADLFRSRIGTYVPQGQPMNGPAPFPPDTAHAEPPPFSRRTF